jgi:tRNA pseudouridine55 synthase
LALKSGAHLVALERTRIGDVRLEDCWQIDDLMKHVEADILKNTTNIQEPLKKEAIFSPAG